jgi:DNA-binding HxlR family transcriptional regulator
VISKKKREAPERAQRRCYRQFCGLARALDMVGERWTLLIVRDMLLGPRRYSDLLQGLPGLTTNLLARRLKEMEAAGLIERVETPPPARASVYQLTPMGRELEPVVMALGRWGGRFLEAGPDANDTVNIGWGLVSLKRRYVGGYRGTVELQVGERIFQVRMTPDYFDVREGTPWDPQLRIGAEQATLAALFFRGASAGALLDEGRIELEGERAAWSDFVEALALVA